MRVELVCAFLVMQGACSPVTTDRCKADTLFVAYRLGDGVQTADTVDVTVTVGDGAPQTKSITRKTHAASGSIEIDFATYPAGKSIAVALTARLSGEVVAEALQTTTAPPGCAALSFQLDAPGAPAQDMAAVALSDMAAAGTVPAQDIGMTNPFAGCGDGRVDHDAGEQCEPLGGADTATCNGNSAAAIAAGVACRYSGCGDGYTNTAAGEKCDDGNTNACGLCNNSAGCTVDTATAVTPRAASGTLSIRWNWGYIEGDFFTLSDGWHRAKFVFTKSPDAVAASGNVPIDITPLSGNATVFDNRMARRVCAAVKVSGLNITASGTGCTDHGDSSKPDDANVALANNATGVVGNISITAQITHPDQLQFTGMSGGVAVDCDTGIGCTSGNDCSSRFCAPVQSCSGGGPCPGTCAVPSCTDNQKNGTETDVDCGGSCPKGCDTNQLCITNDDCASRICAPPKFDPNTLQVTSSNSVNACQAAGS